MTELVIVIVEGPGAGREFPLAGSLVAGRDPSAANACGCFPAYL